ncbi:hypothetical protein B0H13DRAFT_2105710 [Mycena leptocephala]|nr:hypothetical protein B0H13DRAFT_2105710 [Mycena leptocephala]
MKTTSKKSVGEKKKAHTQCTARNKPLKKKFRREFEEIRLSKQRPFGETWVPMIMAISLKSCSRQLTFALNEREEMRNSIQKEWDKHVTVAARSSWLGLCLNVRKTHTNRSASISLIWAEEKYIIEIEERRRKRVRAGGASGGDNEDDGERSGDEE